MKHVILYCNMLRYLTLSHDDCEDTYNMSFSPTEMVALQTSRENLHSLNIRVFENTQKSNDFLRAIFIVYPNIKELSFTCDFLVREDFDVGEAVSDETLHQPTTNLSFTNFLKIIHSKADELLSLIHI